MNKKIKLSLLGALIASSALAITLPIVSCSASSEETPIIVTADSDKLTDSSNIVTKLLKDELALGKTIQAQKNIVKEWKLNENLPQNYIDEIKEALNFTTSESKSVSGHDAIESIIFNSAASIPDSGTISGPELKVVLKKEYTSENDILIQVGDLGEVLGDIVFGESEVLNSGLLTNSLGPFISDASKPGSGSREAQQAVLDSWVVGENVDPNIFLSFSIATTFKINDATVLFKDVVESLVYYNIPELPPTGEEIKNIQVKINFKPEYASTKTLLITSFKIAIAL